MPRTNESGISERTRVWFGDKDRDELLVEIDRLITTDKPALANLYEELDQLRAALHEIVDVLHAVKSGPRAVDEAEMLALAALATQGDRPE